ERPPLPFPRSSGLAPASRLSGVGRSIQIGRFDSRAAPRRRSRGPIISPILNRTGFHAWSELLQGFLGPGSRDFSVRGSVPVPIFASGPPVVLSRQDHPGIGPQRPDERSLGRRRRDRPPLSNQEK